MSNQKSKKQPANEKQVEPEIDISKLISAEVQKQFAVIENAISDIVATELKNLDMSHIVNIDQLVNRVLENVNLKKTKSEIPSFAQMDATECFNQCFEKSLSIVMDGQVYNYVKSPKNCKSLMASAIKMANNMFDVIAEEFEIPS